MGTFSNTKYTATIDSLVQTSKSKLNNPYYIFSDKKPTKVNYWKQNKPKTTLDSGSMLNYAHVSPQSAIRFNKINNFILLGIGNMPIEYDVGDNGVEANAISGDAVILPNTIEPFPGDFFSIPYIKEDLLFKVDNVTPDTLDTRANFYKIEYHLELTNSIVEIEKQVVAVFNFIVENVGTEFNCLISSDDYSLIERLDDLTSELCDIFTSYFYSTKVQTYVYKYDSYLFYDPCMIEFMRRNKLMGNDEYVAHQTYVSHTFPLEYAKSIFYAIEKKDLKMFLSALSVSADLITEPNSLFYVRLEDYFKIRYNDVARPLKTRFEIFSGSIISHMKNNERFRDSDSNMIFNALMGYFYGEDDYISDSIVNSIHSLDDSNSKDIFYMIPIYIYIIRQYISDNILSISSNPATIQ